MTNNLLPPHIRLGFFNIRDAAAMWTSNWTTSTTTYGVQYPPPVLPDAGGRQYFYNEDEVQAIGQWFAQRGATSTMMNKEAHEEYLSLTAWPTLWGQQPRRWTLAQRTRIANQGWEAQPPKRSPRAMSPSGPARQPGTYFWSGTTDKTTAILDGMRYPRAVLDSRVGKIGQEILDPDSKITAWTPDLWFANVV